MAKYELLADGIEVYLGDCREVLPSLAGVNHIISDPPYEDEMHAAVGNINRIRNDGQRTREDLGFSGVNFNRADYARLMVEASNGWLICFTLAEGVRAWRDEIQKNGGKWDTTLAWIKPDASPRFNGQGAARGFECAVTAWCGTGYRSWNGGGKRGVYTHCVNTARQSNHPTLKPTPLMVELVMDFTKPDELVCDPFMGSGTTGLACIKAGRRFVGIEQKQEYYDDARRRIELELKQGDLFMAPPKLKQGKLAL
jgi:site-specific DNA-methyltransferase (adenine-specific)